MRVFILISILSTFGCSTAKKSATSLNSANTNGALTDTQRSSLIAALKIVFVDPATGNVKTDAYKAYLDWQNARLDASKNIVDAQTDTAKMIWAKKLTRLDQNFTLTNPNIVKTIETLDSLGSPLYQDPSSTEAIKQNNEQAYTSWQTDRLIIVDSIKAEPNDQKKMYFVQKLNLLDRQFRIQFLGLLLKL